MLTKNGIDRIKEADRLLKGKRIGLITSSASVTAELVHNTEVFRREGYRLEVLLAPEHGIWGQVPAGEEVSGGKDPVTGLPVVSLYTKERKHLEEEVLKGLDLIVYDVQDVGCRFYTYISLLHNVMRDCKKAGLPLLILDRINLLGGEVEGNLPEERFFSYVGIRSLPQRYGMTVGELARLFDGEIGLGEGLNILPVSGWKRTMLHPETGLPFVPPSPNIPNFETALVYAGTCLFEGTNLSEGRGTASPFLQIGAPFVEGGVFSEEMNRLHLPGVGFTPAFFTPTASKYKGEPCGGVRLHISDPKRFSPVKTGISLLFAMKRRYPSDFAFSELESGGRSFFSLLSGTELFTKDMRSEEEVLKDWETDRKRFMEERKAYLLYE